MKNSTIFRIGIVLFCLAFLMVGFVSNADSLTQQQANVEKQKEAIKDKLEAQQAVLEANQDKLAAIEKEKDAQQSEIDKMKKAVMEHAFDGDWFLRAYDATGAKMGSKECEEGQNVLFV